jgi:hypothetical protein
MAADPTGAACGGLRKLIFLQGVTGFCIHGFVFVLRW